MKNSAWIFAAWVSLLTVGQAAEGAGRWVAPAASNAAMELHFIGVTPANWQAALDFYTKQLGVELSGTNPAWGNWAKLGAGPNDFWSGKYRSMVFELFDGGRPGPKDRRWGHQQGFRPSIQVNNLDAMVAAAKARGVPFTGEIEATDWGRRIEFSAPEEVRWSLSEARGRPACSDLAQPMIGHIELKAHDVAGQKAFYRDVMGLQLESENARRIILGQGPGKAWLTIEPGGEKQPNSRELAKEPTQTQPILISFMTYRIDEVAARMRKSGVTILREVTRHPDWLGTDLIIADVDGNVIQVVQYDRQSP